MSKASTSTRSLGLFSVMMITVSSVDSIRNLPSTALFGSALIFFFLLGAITFLVPCGLVSAELASTYADEHGGIYLWVKEAFGPKYGFLAVWFQWIENIFWFPTILSFIAGTIGFLLSPHLADNKFFIMTMITGLFWGITLLNLRGINVSTLFTNICGSLGIILPMVIIIVLGGLWYFSGKPLAIHLDVHHWIPQITDPHLWTSLVAIILSYTGMEIAAVHTTDIKNAQTTFPRSIIYSTLIIVLTLVFSSLAIAIVIPAKNLSLVAGIMQSFNEFFSAYNLQWFLPGIAIILVLGSLAGINNWVIAPTRAVLEVARDGLLPHYLQQENKHGAPANLLIGQAIIVTLLCCVFLLMPNVNSSYWLLTALMAQLYMIMYIFMFAAAIKLRYKAADRKRPFKIWGKNYGIWFISCVGIIASMLTILVSFEPPNNINVGSTSHYATLVLIGLVTMSLPPFVLQALNRRSGASE